MYVEYDETNWYMVHLTTTQCFLAAVAIFEKVENPGIDPGASRMQIERSTT